MIPRFLVFFCLFCLPEKLSAQEGLMLGRSLSLPDPGGYISISFADSLPRNQLEQYAFVLIFSSAHSHLDEEDIARLETFVNNGGSLYVGADNAPFFEESNQLTFALFGKYCWGDQIHETAAVNKKPCSNGLFDQRQEIPSGQTTVSFPLDYRLKVEAWSGDEPLILTGTYGDGRIILDGGYSRFNTELNPSPEAAAIFREMILFLLK